MERAACRCSNKERMCNRHSVLSNLASWGLPGLAGLLTVGDLIRQPSCSVRYCTAFLWTQYTPLHIPRFLLLTYGFHIFFSFKFFLMVTLEELTSFETQITEKSRLSEEGVHTACEQCGWWDEVGVEVLCQHAEFCTLYILPLHITKRSHKAFSCCHCSAYG